MCLEIHFRIKDDKLLLQTLSVRTEKVVFSEVHLEGIVVDVVLLFSTASFAPIADMAAFVLVPAMRVEFVVSVEALPAETAFGVPLEAALIDGAGVVVAELLVLPELFLGE